MCADETHMFCNTFSLVMICHTKDIGQLLDHTGEELTTINGLVDDIAGISTLNEKPKFITIQAYAGKIFTLQFFSTFIFKITLNNISFFSNLAKQIPRFFGVCCLTFPNKEYSFYFVQYRL